MNHLARSTDISTSHDAADHLVVSGKHAQQQDLAAAAVKLHPGLTSFELARAIGECRFMLARRLPELLEDGRVWRGPKKPCEVSGRSACTWWPVALGDNFTMAV